MREAIRTIGLWAICIFCISAQIQAQSCTASAGQFSPATLSRCPGDSIQVNVNGAFVGEGYVTEYWLTDTNRVFLAKASSTGKFGPRAAGKYFVFAFNHQLNNTAAFPPQIDSTITRVRSSSSGCFALSDSLTLFVEDLLPPVVRCKNVTLYLDEEGTADLSTASVDDGSFEECSEILNPRLRKTQFTCADLGENANTYYLEDASGNLDSCNFTVTVLDTIRPVANCRNVTIYLNANGVAILNADSLNLSSRDNCGGIQNLEASPNRFTCANLGENLVILTVRDSSNNVSLCTATVTVLDTVRPTAICKNIEVFLDEEGQASILPSAVDNESVDNCGTIASLDLSQTNFTCADLGEKRLTLTVTDRSGNQQTCTAIVTVRDTIKPRVQCRTTTIFLGADGQAVLIPILINASSSDNCAGLTYRLSRDRFFCADRGQVEVTLYATDVAGNTDSCSTLITVVDQVKPDARCQNITVYLDATGKAVVTPAMINNGSADNCILDSVALDKTTFTCENIGENLVTLTVYDAEGNSAVCLAAVTVLDTLNPSFQCPADLIVNSNADGDLDCSYTVTNRRLNPSNRSDNCGISRVYHNFTAAPSDSTLRGATFPVGLTQVLWTIEDANGRRQTCTVNVTVRDVLPPVPVCADTVLVQLGTNGTLRIDSSTVDAGSYDNCSIVQFSLSKVDFTCKEVGFHRITVTLRDASGNMSDTVVVVGIIAGTACGSPKISNAKGPKIGDPCSCRGNGAFDEEIVIGPALPNQIWRVKSTTLRDSLNLNVYAAGTLFREVKIKPDSSIYVLRGVHLDGQGYTLEAESPLFPNTLSISNLCKYPQAQIFDLDNPICLFTPAIALSGNGGAGVQGTGSFRINGQTATTFNPRTLGTGTHQVTYTFDAGNPAGKLLPKDVGCTSTLTKQVVVIKNEPTFACRTDLSINVNSSCEVLITPAMLMVNKFDCYDDFEVILNFNGTLVPNPVPASYVGRTINGFIRFRPSPNIISCNVNIVLQDITGPQILSCPADKTTGLVCTDYDSIFNNIKTIDPTFRNFTGRPVVEDNCGGTTITFSDAIFNFANCHPTYARGIIRTFTVKDKFGNASTCIQQFFFRRPTTIFFPKDTLVKTNCEQAALPTDAQGNLSPTIAGRPWFINGFGKKVYLDNSANTCNYSATYTDQRVTICGARYALIRNWRLIDWCDPSRLLEKRQYVEVGDFDAPIVGSPELDLDRNGIIDDTLRYSVAPFNCFAAFALPSPKIKDCSATTLTTEIYSWQPETISGFPTGRIIWAKLDLPVVNGQLQNVPLGIHYFIFTVRDICNQETKDTVAFNVLDRIAPTMVCNSEFVVSLGGGGMARITNADVNRSSRDNCDNALKLEVRRLIPAECAPDSVAGYSLWDAFVDIACCDVGKLVTIELRGTDKYGNTNTCITRLQVDDKLPPTCTPPPNRTINCNDIPVGLDISSLAVLQRNFGLPTVEDNCAVTWEELTPLVDLNNCRVGSITRKFRAKDAAGNFSESICEQVITVNPVHNYEIKFPKDVVSYCGTPLPDTLLLNELACDDLAFNVEDRQLTIPGGGCYQIFRTYQVINLCEYDDVSAPIILSRDMDCDLLPGDENLWLMVRPNGVTYLDKDNNENNVFPRNNERGRSCDGLGNPIGHWSSSNINQSLKSRGFWQYTQQITVIDTVKPAINYTQGTPFCSNDNSSCNGSIELSFTIFENCTPGSLQVSAGVDLNNNGTIDRQLAASEIQGTYPNFQIKGSYPIGTHSFVVQVKDACGNIGIRNLTFRVVDCKAPSPICKSGITVTLQALNPARDINGDGKEDLAYAVVKAADFIASPTTDCSGPIRYSITREGVKPNINQDSLILTCTDEGTVIVQVYAWDSANNPLAVQPDGRLGGPNYDFCLNFVTVQNNGDICIPLPQGILGGIIQTESQQGLPNVEVILSGQASNRTNSSSTGNYIFLNLAEGKDYTLTPKLNTDHANGVSTFDLIQIRKHILGVATLNSPYKMIAADANASKSITTLDLIAIQKLILNLDIAFKNNSSWRFVDANYRFPDPSNPWLQGFPESHSINDLVGQKLAANFIAVKIGDVNVSANLGFKTPEIRTENDPMWLEVEDQNLQSGQVHSVAIRVKDLANIQGYQMALSYTTSSAELVDIQYGLAKAENFGIFKSEGLITTNWYNEHPMLNPDAVLFTLVFRAKAKAKLSEVLHLSLGRMQVEAYNFADERLPIQLRYNETEIQAPNFELYQNVPNPFQESTLIRFYLPETSEGRVLVFDAAGRLLKDIKGDFVQGVNQIELRDEELPSGVLYYTFRSARYSATRKMIKK